MTDRPALLAAVCARPDDDTPRLVFADWCDDHGDPDYARFIRAQVDLARVPEWDRLWVRTWHRENDLITGCPYRERYPLPPAAPGNRPAEHTSSFRRGFPWTVEYPTPFRFAQRATDLFTLAPFQSVTLGHPHGGALPSLIPLTTDPRITRLRRVAFVHSRLGADEIRRLADSPHLGGLTALSFESDAITSDGVAELLRSGLPGRLTRLTLGRGPRVEAAVFREFGDSSTLRSLTLTEAELAGPDVGGLFATPLLRGLVELDLSGNRLGPDGVTALVATSSAATLESLTMRQTSPGVAGGRALAESPALANLRRLGLRDCGLGPAAAAALARSPHLRGLTVLDLAGNAIGDKGVLALAASPYLRNLAHLDLARTRMTDRGLAALLDSPVVANLERLDLHSAGDFAPELLARVRERFG